MAKSKRYDEGGVAEGQNAGIDDDTRARAMKYVQEQSDSAGVEESTPSGKSATKATKTTKTESKAEAKADARGAEAGRSRGRPAEGAPKTTVSRSEAREPSGEPTPGRKSDWRTDSELGRNVSNTLSAMGPTRLAGISNAAAEGVMTARAAKAAEAAAQAAKATRAARTAKVAPRAAREAKTLNPNAWMAGPKGMKENFKSGGMTASSRGDGIASRGKTRGKMC